MVGISVIIPILNEAATLADFLQQLQPMRQRDCEIIVVDGGSEDASAEIAVPFADQVVQSARGRAVQMNTGAQIARGTVLWFLHSDSIIPAEVDQHILQALAASHKVWGRFDVRLSGDALMLRTVATMMNIRSRYSGIATGDQGIFVERDAFLQLGGYPVIALMEDITISRNLKRLSRPLCLQQKLITSSRRWQQNGIVRTIVLMWWLRLLYFFGVKPDCLARRYY